MLRSDSAIEHMRSHLNNLNSNSELQSSKARKGWTEERRKAKSAELAKVDFEIFHTDKYPEARQKIIKSMQWHRVVYNYEDGSVLKLRSFLEARIVKMFELNDIKFEYESFSIDYINPFDNNVHKYVPDFYLRDLNLIIEGKSKFKTNDAIVCAKRNAAVSQGYNYLMITEDNLKNWKSILDKISALRIK
jgi:hypothetical protein